jgi:hypothetical protein
MRALLLLWTLVSTVSAGEYTIFAFDDHTIPFRHNLQLTMQAPRKYEGNPVVPRGSDDAPDAIRAQFYGSVLRIGDKWRMWYAAMANDRAVGARMTSFRVAYAESKDGLHWTKPSLQLADYKGSRENNLVALSPELDYSIVEPLACFVLHEPDDPDPSRRYKMAMYGRYYDRSDTQHRRPHATIYPYFSADGLSWRLARQAPKGGAFDETEAPFRTTHVFEIGGLYRFNGVYYAAGQELWPDVWMPDGAPSGRAMTVRWSGDFINWSQEKAFAFQRYGYRSLKHDLEEAHQPAGVWNRGNVLVATYGLWHGATYGTERRMDLGLLVSNDGLHFREPWPEFTFLAAGRPGEWDRNGLIHGQGYVNTGDSTFIYYGTWDLAATKEAGGAVGVATLPRDRFGYVSPRFGGEGTFTTIPIPPRYSPGKLRVNADGLSPEARIEFALLDEAGKELPGYGWAQAAVLQTSGFDVPVRWPTGGPVPSPYRLSARVAGKDAAKARFYAAYIDE